MSPPDVAPPSPADVEGGPSGHPAPAYGYPVPGYGYPVPGYGHPAPGYGYPAPGYGYPVPGYGYPAPAYGYPAPGYGHPPTAPLGAWGYAMPSPWPGAVAPAPVPSRAADGLGSGAFLAKNAGELLDSMFALYRRNLRQVLAASAVIQVPVVLATFLLQTVTGYYNVIQQAQNDLAQGNYIAYSNATASVAGLGLLISGLTLMSIPFTVGVVMAVAGERYLNRPVTLGMALRTARQRFWPLAGALILVGLIGLGAIIVMAIFAGVTVVATGPVGLVIVLFGGAFLTLLIYARVCLAPVCAVIEQAGPGRAINRSLALTKGARAGIALMLMVTVMTSLLLQLAVAGVASMPGIPGFAQAASGIAQVLTGPLVTLTLTVVYFDRRIRREAFDIDMIPVTL